MKTEKRRKTLQEILGTPTLTKWTFAGFRLVCQFQNHTWTRFKPQKHQKITYVTIYKSQVPITWLLLKYILIHKMVLESKQLCAHGAIKLRDHLRVQKCFLDLVLYSVHLAQSFLSLLHSSVVIESQYFMLLKRDRKTQKAKL